MPLRESGKYSVKWSRTKYGKKEERLEKRDTVPH
jgi:hypothetical protein